MTPGEHMVGRCPHCERPFAGKRFGVTFGDVAIRIIDMVKHAGPDGIKPDELFEAIYRNRPSKRTALKGYVRAINERLRETSDVRISARGGNYHIAKIEQ